MLAGTALVPAAAQTFDLSGLVVVVTNFTGPPANNPAVITNGTLRVNTAGSLTFSGELSDVGGVFALQKIGAGSLTLSGVNTSTGGLRVFDGTVFAGSLTAFSAGGPILTGSGLGTTSIVDLNGFSQTTTFLQSSGAGASIVTSTTGPATLTIASTQSRTFDGGLQGDLAIVKQGVGTQTFLNTNAATTPATNTGAITLQQGGISVGANNVLGSGIITVTGASTLFSAAVAGPVALNNAIVLNAALTVNPNAIAPLILTGNISGGGSLTKINTGSTLALTGDNSYAGGSTLTAGRVLIGSNTALGLGAVLNTGATLALNDVAVGRAIANNFNASAAALTVEAGNVGTIFELAGNIAGTRSVVLAAAGGDGTVLLSGTNNFTGETRVQSGVLGIGSAGAVASTSAIRLEANGTGIALHSAGVTVTRAVTSVVAGGAVSGTIDTRGLDATFSGRLSDAVTGVDNLALTKTALAR